ncbi:MAG: membrane dipeptidase [Anaerolineales bacterium]|nr:membrane dipeptidase [Anaerolineales bacterium]
MLIIDSHEDLAYNMLTYGRDYRRSAAETRQREAGTPTPEHNGDTLLGWSDYQRGRVAVIFSTLYASPAHRRLGEWDTQYYATYDEAHDRYSAQLDIYHQLADENPDYFRILLTRAGLEERIADWNTDAETHPVGLVVLMEGAEGVRDPGELEEWWRRGLRIIGPAWAGTRFCGGTRQPGPLTADGFALLERMGEIGFALDISHMDEQAVLQALDIYPKAIIASHSNALALIKGSESNRHLTDRVIEGLLRRNGVIGVLPSNSFLVTDWKERGRASVTLDAVVAQIDYICQKAGDAHHVGLGSDFDGGFGVQSVPEGIDTIADLNKLTPLLAHKGYSEGDIAAILGGNWLNFLRNALPESV